MPIAGPISIPSHHPYLLPACSWGTRNLELLLQKKEA